jgi:hypothetical protein
MPLRPEPSALEVWFALPSGSLLLDWTGPAEAFRLAHTERPGRPFSGCALLRPRSMRSVDLQLAALEALPEHFAGAAWRLVVGKTGPETARAEASEARAVVEWLSRCSRAVKCPPPLGLSPAAPNRAAGPRTVSSYAMAPCVPASATAPCLAGERRTGAIFGPKTPRASLSLAEISRAAGLTTARWPARSPSGRPGCDAHAGSCPRAGSVRRARRAGACEPLPACGRPSCGCRSGRR